MGLVAPYHLCARGFTMGMRCYATRLAGFAAVLVLAQAPDSRAATYYLNDTGTVGDVYATGVGDDANAGTNPAAPKLTFTNLLATYTLVAGDTVYVDTGIYTNYGITLSASGVSTNKITIQGSTNYAAGGTVFNRANASDAVIFVFGDHYRIRDLLLRGGQYGLYMAGSENDLYRITARNMSYGFYGGGGISNRYRNCVAFQNTFGFRWGAVGWVWDLGVSWGNGTAFLFDGAGLTVSNSVIVGGSAFSVGIPKGDYNVVWDSDINIGGYATLSELQQGENSWRHSIYADPGFANPTNLDFHPLSTAGRFVVGGTEVTDTVHSILIDFACRGVAFSNEPPPNGGRANAGNFGNTSEASKSRTNAWVLATSYNEGGGIQGTGRLFWTYGNMPATQTVTLAYTTNSGATWITITNAVAVSNENYTWVANGLPPAVAQWRVRGNGAHTGAVDAIDFRFSLNGGLVPYYVNDASTIGDIYCAVAGSETNSGISPNQPMASVTNVLRRYKVAPGSVIFVDTGTYSNYLMNFASGDQGSRFGRVVLQGSTNVNAGGTVFRRNASDFLLFVPGSYFDFNDITLRDASYGAYVAGSECRFTRVISRNNSQFGYYGRAAYRTCSTAA
jgi:hypothetical protein